MGALTLGSQAHCQGQQDGRYTRISPAFPLCTGHVPGRCLTTCHTCIHALTLGQNPDHSPSLQAQVVVLEQSHSPAQLEADAQQQQLELQQEVERLRSAQVQTERTLEARERAHRQRVRGLEEQVCRPPRKAGPGSCVGLEEEERPSQDLVGIGS